MDLDHSTVSVQINPMSAGAEVPDVVIAEKHSRDVAEPTHDAEVPEVLPSMQKHSQDEVITPEPAPTHDADEAASDAQTTTNPPSRDTLHECSRCGFTCRTNAAWRRHLSRGCRAAGGDGAKLNPTAPNQISIWRRISMHKQWWCGLFCLCCLIIIFVVWSALLVDSTRPELEGEVCCYAEQLWASLAASLILVPIILTLLSGAAFGHCLLNRGRSVGGQLMYVMAASVALCILVVLGMSIWYIIMIRNVNVSNVDEWSTQAALSALDQRIVSCTEFFHAERAGWNEDVRSFHYVWWCVAALHGLLLLVMAVAGCCLVCLKFSTALASVPQSRTEV